ncbi:MAG TPA: MFS transporter [Rhizomicrobium sp.]|jgi:EmrB/QacA subfamily drug resistance transporter|nr:MFS transporter [Rhizomicrobium sp.]
MSQFINATCDTALAGNAADGPRPAHPALVLTTTILASSLAFVDGSVVNVGLPAIRASFGATAETLQWVVNAYLLLLSALLLLGGAVGDRFGRKRLLIGGIAIFALASLFCATAADMPWLLLGRAVQGIGAAVLLPNSLAILGDAFTGAERGRAIGIWAAMGAIAGAIGPVLGGFLIDTVGWRAIFLLNLPLAAGAIALTLVSVEDTRAGADRASLDVLGGLLATVGLGALTWALTIGSGRAGWNGEAILAAAAGAALTLAFVWLERVRGERAMMPLALFGSRTFVGLTLLTFFLYGALGGLLVLLPYVLIVAAHYSGTEAGAALLPFPLVVALASPVMGGLAGRIGPRLPLALGPIVVAAGFCLLLRIDGSNGYWSVILPAVLVIALGMAGAVAPLTTAVLASVDQAHTGSASGFNSAVSRTGGLVVTALLGAILGASGQELIADFHAAALAGAAVAIAASASAFLLVKA